MSSRAELGGLCVTGLSAGLVVDNGCPTKWTSPEGKTYCFQNDTAKQTFLKDPEKLLAKAKDYFAALPASALNTKAFTEEDAEDAVLAIVKKRTKDGAFIFSDTHVGKELKLKFEKIKIVRGMSGYGWFPNVIFSLIEDPKKQYAIDFWFKPAGQELQLMDIRVQKGPWFDGEDYILRTRQPVAWWWLPVSEHPGDAEVTRAWHVMAAIHKHVAESEKDGIYMLKDEKTGETVPLEFVEIHQPVRRLSKDGRYFACTDFRKKGSKNEFYDVDFWLDRSSGDIKVGSVRIHKVPVQDQENGLWYQEKRYNFRGLNFDVVN